MPRTGKTFTDLVLAEQIAKRLGDKSLKWGDNRALRKALLSIVGMKGQIGKVNAIMNGINQGIITAGSQVSAIVTALKGADTTTKMTEIAAKKSTEAAATAAKERIEKLAIEKGIWNNGIGLTPSDNPSGTNPADEGSQSGKQTVGSFLGG